ncbi:MAG TPA: prepilin-type N-terminal cleavage/methylation domain-containing protein [Tepiditoga sp.]|nr:prepilin-type N-terminal cleavage/methylation domain-containing protein [Tepiditoga sp.]
MKKLKEGFTLVEVLVVLAIIAIIGTITVPTANSLISQAKATKGVTEMKSIQSAVLNYLIYNETIPDDISVQKLADEGYIDAVPEKINVRKNSVDVLSIDIVYGSESPEYKYFLKIDSNMLKDENNYPYLKVTLR